MSFIQSLNLLNPTKSRKISKVCSFCLVLSSARGAGSRIHEQLSRGLWPVLSGDLPAWIYFPAEQLLWEVWALLKVHIYFSYRLRRAEAVVERRRSLGPGGAVDLLLWVQREVPNSCGSQGSFRGQWGMEGLGSHGNSIWPQNQVPVFVLISTFFGRNIHFLYFIIGEYS